MPFGYNPVSLILEDFAEYWKPRMIGMDCVWARENGFKSSNIFLGILCFGQWVVMRGVYLVNGGGLTISLNGIIKTIRPNVLRASHQMILI